MLKICEAAVPSWLYRGISFDLDQDFRAIKRLTSTMLVAGRMSLKISPWAEPICSHWSMFATYIRVRTTSCNVAPSLPATAPSGAVAVVPEMNTNKLCSQSPLS